MKEDGQKFDHEADPFKPIQPGEKVSPEHEAWLKAEIEKTIAKVDAGEVELFSLEEVMAKHRVDEN